MKTTTQPPRNLRGHPSVWPSGHPRSAVTTALVTLAPLATTTVSAATSTPAGTQVVDGDTAPVASHLSATMFSTPGPLGVGETTLTLPTDGAPVEVWYPATKASVAGKPVATYNVATWLPASLQKLIPAGFSVTYPSGGVTGVAVAPAATPWSSSPRLRRLS